MAVATDDDSLCARWERHSTEAFEEAVRGLKNEPRPSTPEAHVDIGVSAFIPKTWIPGDRQRMDVYRRLTRCTDLNMLNLLEHDVKDAFGEAPR